MAVADKRSIAPFHLGKILYAGMRFLCFHLESTLGKIGFGLAFIES
jgi:hypothetical protein